jgi:Mg2+-importing ATPase
MQAFDDNYWSLNSAAVLAQEQTSARGLTADEARRRLARYGPNRLQPAKQSDTLTLLAAQFKSPIVLILFFAAGLSAFLGEITDALIILVIIVASGLLGFWQERGAADVVRKLTAMVQTKSLVLRDGQQMEISSDDIVPGDIVKMAAGMNVSADCLLLDANDLFVNEAVLTGETFPVEKSPATVSAGESLSDRTNCLFMGTYVVSGSGTAVVLRTGLRTEFGKISGQLKFRAPETEFEHGVRSFGYLLVEITLLLVIAIFAVNVYLHRPVLDSLIFSLALAVGLTPQLLPAIISINLAHGARRMSQKKVVVKRLASIENFGSMNVLCSDKTGTLTEGQLTVTAAVGIDGKPSAETLLCSYLSAVFETGFKNPIDEAIRTFDHIDVSAYRKLDEIPYDFLRKRNTVVAGGPKGSVLVTKGALTNVLNACSLAMDPGGRSVPLSAVRPQIEQYFEDQSRGGLRVMGVAKKHLDAQERITKDDERDMVFVGFLILSDPVKAHAPAAIQHLRALGITLKMITGDHHLVAEHIGREVGMRSPRVLTSGDIRYMSDDALVKQLRHVDIVAEVDPSQKERIIQALKKGGDVVGYMGDGINDASALHAADVGISVDSGVDALKEAADIVLLKKDLTVLIDGVLEGRRTFANTLKYVFMATSANFGNMFSMAGASLFLPFLPLLPKQILLTNLLTDMPEMTIATDKVDDEQLKIPRRWDIVFIRKFMITFGLVSSLFDFVTFFFLIHFFHANVAAFRTGWFIESVISAACVVLIIRSRKPLFASRPGKYLAAVTALIAAVTLIIPYTPLAALFGFTPLPLLFLVAIAVIIVGYGLTAEIAKHIFYRTVKQ